MAFFKIHQAACDIHKQRTSMSPVYKFDLKLYWLSLGKAFQETSCQSEYL